MRRRGRKTEKVRKTTHTIATNTCITTGNPRGGRVQTNGCLMVSPFYTSMGLPLRRDCWAQPIRGWTGMTCVSDGKLCQLEPGLALSQRVTGGQLWLAGGMGGGGTGHCLTCTKPACPFSWTPTRTPALALQDVELIQTWTTGSHKKSFSSCWKEGAHWSPCSAPSVVRTEDTVLQWVEDWLAFS